MNCSRPQVLSEADETVAKARKEHEEEMKKRAEEERLRLEEATALLGFRWIVQLVSCNTLEHLITS